MSRSLSEVDAKVRAATRGAGYDWGLAEEAGRAVCWLCARGQDGVAALADLLTDMDGCEHAAAAPRDPLADHWTGRPALCPIVAGTTLSDFARTPTVMTEVRVPLLLVPFLSDLDGAFRIEWDGGEATVCAEALTVNGGLPRVSDVSLEASAARPTPSRFQRATPDPTAWDTLDRFAHRTLAPATEESRRKGAG